MGVYRGPSRAAMVRALEELPPDQRRLLRHHLDRIERIKAGDPLTARITRVRDHLDEIADLLPALEAELKVRQTAFEELRAQAEQTEKYAALHKDHAEAVQKLVDENRKTALTEATALVVQELAKTSQDGKKQQVRYFLLGLAGSVPLGVAGNFLFEWLTK